MDCVANATQSFVLHNYIKCLRFSRDCRKVVYAEKSCRKRKYGTKSTLFSMTNNNI